LRGVFGLERIYGITVEEALGMDVFKNSRLVGGRGGLGRLITNVNVMEVPDILDWVQEGELLLTTAFSIKDDPEAQHCLIPELAHRGLAGLAIKTKRYLEAIPQEMIRAADELNFPLIELSPETSHPLVLNAIFTRLLSRQTAFLKQSLHTHELLLKVMLEGGGLSRIAEVLADLVDNPVLITDDKGELLAFAAGKSQPVLLEQLVSDHGRGFLSDKVEGIHADDSGSPAYRARRYHTKINGKKVECLVVQVVASRRVRGAIVVWEIHRRATRSDIIAIERASVSVALEMVNQAALRSVERRYQNEFLQDLLSGDFESEDLMIHRARGLGWDLSRKYVLLLLRVKSQGDGALRDEIKQDLLAGIENSLRVRYERGIVGDRGQDIFVLLETAPDAKAAKSKALTVARYLKQSIRKRFQGITLLVAVARFYPQLSGFSQAYQEARKVLALLEKSGGETHLVHFDDLGVYRIIFYPQTELDSFVHDTVRPLLEHDRNHQAELCKTLETFFECHGNIKKVADRLFTHYNTVLYRIKRIEEITGVDLSDPEQRLNLQMGLKIARFQGLHN